jgi:hypothetical protein
VLGYPIRTPSDHSSVDNSPRTIAASHVLHRLLMPRHPPCALQHFTHNKHAQTTKPDTKRCSHPLCNTQHTTTPQPTTTTTTPTHRPQRPTSGDALDGPRPRAAPEKTTHQPARCLLRTQQCAETYLTTSGVMFHPATPPQHARGVEITRRKPATPCRGSPPHTGKLLRKEVIQPHLPVRLPCYDFVPIAGPTFDHSPPQVG